MTQFRSALALLVAVLALLAPSLATGFTAAAATEVTVAAAMDDGIELPDYRPCEQQGGKRVLPCHPDLGLLVPPMTAPGWTLAAVPAIAADRMHPLPLRAADPPPPRRD